MPMHLMRRHPPFDSMLFGRPLLAQWSESFNQHLVQSLLRSALDGLCKLQEHREQREHQRQRRDQHEEEKTLNNTRICAIHSMLSYPPHKYYTSMEYHPKWPLNAEATHRVISYTHLAALLALSDREQHLRKARQRIQTLTEKAVLSDEMERFARQWDRKQSGHVARHERQTEENQTNKTNKRQKTIPYLWHLAWHRGSLWSPGQ